MCNNGATTDKAHCQETKDLIEAINSFDNNHTKQPAWDNVSQIASVFRRLTIVAKKVSGKLNTIDWRLRQIENDLDFVRRRTADAHTRISEHFPTSVMGAMAAKPKVGKWQTIEVERLDELLAAEVELHNLKNKLNAITKESAKGK